MSQNISKYSLNNKNVHGPLWMFANETLGIYIENNVRVAEQSVST